MTTNLALRGAACCFAIAGLAWAPLARAEEYPPAVIFSDLIKLGNVSESGGVPVGPDHYRVVYPKNQDIQVNHWLYAGDREDPAKRILGGGEDGKWCYVYGFDDKTNPNWNFDHCFPQRPGGGQTQDRDNVLGPGKYTHILYWRPKGTTEWQKMAVLHFTVEAVPGVGGDARFATTPKVRVVDLYERAAALRIRGDKDVEVVIPQVSTECAPGQEEYPAWVGLFHEGSLAAVVGSTDGDWRCDIRSALWTSTLSKPKLNGRFGAGNFKAPDILGKDGAWTLVVATGKTRRTWDIVVKGGKIELAERQRPSFRPFHYQWVEEVDAHGNGTYWLTPGAAQPINVP